MKTLLKNRVTLLSGTCFMTCLLFLGVHFVRADNVINNGTILTINAGMTVLEYGSSTVIAGGVIDNHGTMIIKGDLVNGNITTPPTDLGPGTFEFSGTTAQSISGLNIFGNLTLNNSTGLTINNDQQVNGILTLSSGLLKLGTSGDKNLLLGPSASVAGPFSASAMVVATGTGELRKEFSGFTSFTYPVGDNTNTAEYSPVKLDFASGGSYPSGNFIGVKLEDAAVPQFTSGTHITRNWTLNNNIAFPITGYSCTASFQYLPADVVLMNGGVEADLYLVKVSPLVTYNATDVGTHTLSGTLTSFSQFTGARPAHEISLIAFLEGPYNSTSGAMNTTLKTLGLIPLNQPYNTPPWNYGGTETVPSIPPNVVDWVLIELRQADVPANATGLTVISTRAALLTSNGAIVDVDGTSPVKFYNSTITTNLFPVIKHRNHLAIMSNNSVSKTNEIYTYNFSSAQTQIYDGTGNGCIQLGSKWGMIAGNADGNSSINNIDLLSWQVNFALTNYNKADFDLNGSVSNLDLVIWQKNFGLVTKVPN